MRARLLAFVGSWRLTALLLLAMAAAYLAFSFGKNPYPAWTAALFHAPAGIAICVGLMSNLAAVSVRIARARLARSALTPDYVRSMDVHIELPLRPTHELPSVLAHLGVLIGGPVTGQGSLHRRRGAWSFLPGTFVRLGLILVIGGLLISTHARTERDTLLREGEQQDAPGAPLSLIAIHADLPADVLRVNDDGPFLLTGVSALLRSGGRTFSVTPGIPTRIDGRWYRIRHLGYAQPVTVSRDGRRMRVDANLDLLPPGRSSIVSLPSGSAFLTFSLDPDRTIAKGLLTGRQYNLARPAYRVTLQEGRPREAAPGRRMTPGEQGTIGPAEVALGDQALFIRLQAVSDPGLPFLYAGVIILLAGCCALFSRFFWYEREIVVLLQEGSLFAGSRDEFYKRWGIYRFQRWREGLAELNLP